SDAAWCRSMVGTVDMIAPTGGESCGPLGVSAGVRTRTQPCRGSLAATSLRGLSRPTGAPGALAQNLLRHRFFESFGGLNVKRPSDLLRVLEDVERVDLPPSQGDHVDGMLRVRPAVQQCGGPVPLDEHRRVPRPTLHPDAVDLELKAWQHTRQALEP